MKIEKEILYRYFNGDATPEEEHKIRQYLEASDENWKEDLRERKFFDTIILKEQVVSEEKQMKRRQLIRKISLECLKVAAVLLIAFGTAFFWNNQSEKPAVLVQPLDDEIRLQVPVSPSPVSLRWNRVVVTGADVGSFRYVATLNSSP